MAKNFAVAIDDHERIDENYLIFITREFPRYIKFHHQCDTNTIDLWKDPGDVYVIQMVNGEFEVYDLATIKRTVGTVTIGLPKFVHRDVDAAIMWALMNV